VRRRRVFQETLGRARVCPSLTACVLSLCVCACACGVLLGDKMRSAPDRIITPGILARIATGAIAGMAVAPPNGQRMGAVLGATAAVGDGGADFGGIRALRLHGVGHPGGSSSKALYAMRDPHRQLADSSLVHEALVFAHIAIAPPLNLRTFQY